MQNFSIYNSSSKKTSTNNSIHDRNDHSVIDPNSVRAFYPIQSTPKFSHNNSISSSSSTVLNYTDISSLRNKSSDDESFLVGNGMTNVDDSTNRSKTFLTITKHIYTGNIASIKNERKMCRLGMDICLLNIIFQFFHIRKKN